MNDTKFTEERIEAIESMGLKNEIVVAYCEYTNDNPGDVDLDAVVNTYRGRWSSDEEFAMDWAENDGVK